MFPDLYQSQLVNYSDQLSDFYEASGMTRQHWPWKSKKPQNGIYADVQLVSCTFKHGYPEVVEEFKDAWYYPYVGIQFFARLRFSFCPHRKHIYLSQVQPARLENSWLYTGRDVGAHDIIIL